MRRSVPCLLVVHALFAASLMPRGAWAAGSEPADWRGDVRVLTSAVDSLHPRPLKAARRAAWDSAAAELVRQLPSMRREQAVAGFSRLLALLHDGHTRLGHLQLAAHARPTLTPLQVAGFDEQYPVEFEVFADGLRITRATAAHARLVGLRVVAIGDTATARAVARLAPVIPADNPMWLLHALPAFLRSPGYLSAVGLTKGPAAPLQLRLEDTGGRRREASLPPEPRDSAAVWVAADDGLRTPLPLTRRLAGAQSFTDLGDTARTVFVRIRAIVDEPGRESFARFVARLFAHVDSVGARRLVLDLRGNGGGNNYLNQPLVHAILRRPWFDRPGRLFVIVDRGTFSAAVSLSADLQRETRAVFVGEPTGGAPNSPGDPARVTLPASGLLVRIATVLWTGSDPRDPRAFIAPDVPAALTWADWLAHRDPALAAIESYRAPAAEPARPPNQRWGSPEQLQAQVPPVAW